MIGGLVIVALLILMWLANRNKPVSTPLGGTTTQGNPSSTAPSGPASGVAASTPVPSNNLVKVIRLTRMTANASKPANDNDDWRTFAIGEVFAYDVNGILLKASDYASAKYVTAAYDVAQFPASNAIDGNIHTFSTTGGTDATHVMELTLAKPTQLKRVEVFNRQDFCPWRLEGTEIALIGVGGNTIWTGKLTSQTSAQKFELA
jgi:hypothetical protein